VVKLERVEGLEMEMEMEMEGKTMIVVVWLGFVDTGGNKKVVDLKVEFFFGVYIVKLVTPPSWFFLHAKG
jgi:hypothetical protein